MSKVLTVSKAVGEDLDNWLLDPNNKNQYITKNNGRIPICEKLIRLTGKTEKQANAAISDYISRRRDEKLIDTCPSDNAVEVGGPTKTKRLKKHRVIPRNKSELITDFRSISMEYACLKRLKIYDRYEKKCPLLALVIFVVIQSPICLVIFWSFFVIFDQSIGPKNGPTVWT